jgi:hypothetical protein
VSDAAAQQNAANADDSAGASEEPGVQAQSRREVVRRLLESVERARSPAARSEEACSF